jgi:hypothetical protein
MACRSFSKLSAEEKQKAREQIRWSLYDRMLRPGIH